MLATTEAVEINFLDGAISFRTGFVPTRCEKCTTTFFTNEGSWYQRQTNQTCLWPRPHFGPAKAARVPSNRFLNDDGFVIVVCWYRTKHKHTYILHIFAFEALECTFPRRARTRLAAIILQVPLALIWIKQSLRCHQNIFHLLKTNDFSREAFRDISRGRMLLSFCWCFLLTFCSFWI